MKNTKAEYSNGALMLLALRSTSTHHATAYEKQTYHSCPEPRESSASCDTAYAWATVPTPTKRTIAAMGRR